jgi:hypothetical protein
MKLQELLSEIFSSGEYPKVNSRFGIVDGTIYGEDLEQFKERILQCEEFSECEELIIMKYPVTILENGRTVQNVTYKHKEGQKYKGKCYLLSLALTPEMFDPKTMHTPVLDGACITPTMYDPTTFEPKKKIVLEFSPEALQDDVNSTEEVKRKQLHDTLDKIFDNPELYEIKGERALLVRGYFEEIHSPFGVEKTDLVGINPEKQTHKIAAYFFEKDEKNSTESQVNLKLSTIPIPIELSDKFVEEIGTDPMKITREQVEEFLKRNQ